MADTPARTIRIALLDDHALFRESVARLLAAEPEFEVVAAWGSMEEALPELLSEPVDIVLLDFDLGQRDGTQFLRSARERGYGGKVLVVTAGVEKEEAAALIRNGISGIFTKNNSAALLAEGIRDVMAGKLWVENEAPAGTRGWKKPRCWRARAAGLLTGSALFSAECSRGWRIRKLPIDCTFRKAR